MAQTRASPVFNENGDRQTGGFLPDIFSSCDQIQKFLCCHCQKILRDPVQGYCGHRFCRSCRDELLSSVPENTPLDCPACIDEKVDPQEVGKIIVNQMFPDNAVKRELTNKIAKCVFPGCTWEGKFRDYETHELQCQYRLIACALCAEPVTDETMEQHRSSQCSQRIVTCEFCDSQQIAARLQAHSQACEKFPVKCELCAQPNILREQMKDHLEKHCPKRTITCPVGCNTQFPLDKFSEHLHPAVDQHLVWTLQKILALEQRLESGAVFPSVLQQVKGELSLMDKKIQSLDQQLKQYAQNRSSSTSSESGAGDSARSDVAQGQEAKAPKTSPELLAKASLYLVEPIIAVLHNELDKATHALGILEGHFRQQQAQMDELEVRFRALQQSLSLKDAAIADLEMRLAAQEMARYDGTILWKVSGFEAKKKDAISGQTTSLYSPAFYSGPCGYKMCARIYPNGDGIGKGSHISLFFVIMRGHYDALLPWPFSQKVTLMMIDQNHKEHIVDAFKPDPNSTSFKRPTTEMNIASGCPLFLPLEKLHSRQHGYLRDDTIFVKIIVDTDGLDRYTEINPGRYTMGYP